MLQILEGLSKNGYRVGYCSGEESVYQLAYTCKRIGVKNVEIANITDIDEICKLSESYDLLIIDSFQALTTKKKMNMRQKEVYAVQHLVKVAKANECCMGFIMHLTKDGKLKGSTVVPHTVDACLNIDPIVSDDEGARCIYFSKNRFGPCNELETLITRTGYDFKAKVVKPEDKDQTVKKAPSKSNRKKTQIEALTKIFEAGSWVQIGELCKVTDDDVSRAQFLLRELVTKGHIEKYGRGANAYWRKKA